MVDKRSQADRLLVAELYGEARHRAQWRGLSGDEEASAVAELRTLAGGRTDLLAEVAGVLEGTSEGEPDEPLARQAAGLCRQARADSEAIPAWVAEGGVGGRRPGSRRFRAASRSRVRTRAADRVRDRPGCRHKLGLLEFAIGYSILMSVPKIRLTAVIMDVLDILTDSPPDNPAWGLRLCEVTGYGTGTIYPALERLMEAGWITDQWEDPPPADRPRTPLLRADLNRA